MFVRSLVRSDWLSVSLSVGLWCDALHIVTTVCSAHPILCHCFGSCCVHAQHHATRGVSSNAIEVHRRADQSTNARWPDTSDRWCSSSGIWCHVCASFGRSDGRSVSWSSLHGHRSLPPPSLCSVLTSVFDRHPTTIVSTLSFRGRRPPGGHFILFTRINTRPSVVNYTAVAVVKWYQLPRCHVVLLLLSLHTAVSSSSSRDCRYWLQRLDYIVYGIYGGCWEWYCTRLVGIEDHTL